MAHGPGKYDNECTQVRTNTKATGVLLVVLGGDKGNGFSVQAPLAVQHELPVMLELIARGIRADLAGMPSE